MPVISAASSSLAIAMLMFVWFGPLPRMASHTFAAHMSMHIAVVAVIAPLLALSIGGTRLDPVRLLPRLLPPIPISLVEFVIVWAWHVPALYEAARQEPVAFVLEQASFLCSGTLLWLAALGGNREQRRMRAGAGVAALLFTSMHMTLLGALFAIAGRPLFQHAVASGGAGVADQQLGGVIMLLVGGTAYLAGGLWLTAVALRPALPNALPGKERSA
jgi:putative membrane protein